MNQRLGYNPAMRWLAALLLLTPLAPAGAAAPAPPQVTGEKVEAGVYRFRGEGDVSAPVAPLVAMVTAYDQQCRKGCRYTVKGVDRTLILPGERDGLFYTWSHVDDVLDASYFVAVEITKEGARTTVRYSTPDAAALARLADAEHPHEPFFYHQDGSWTFDELPPGDDGALRTRVTATLEMRSKSFLVNLMPGQIVDRTREHLLLIYRYLGEAGRD